jgi:hypothetical protein
MFPTEAGPAEEPTTSNEPTPTPTTNPVMSMPYQQDPEIMYSAFDHHHHHHHHHFYDKSGKGNKGGKSGKGSKFRGGSKDGYRRMR